MRSMELDFGDKTIGIAVSDALGWTAQSKAVIRRKNLTEDFLELQEYITEYGIEEIVVGLPLNMDGTAGGRVEKTMQFVNFLKKRLDIPIVLWDERLSSKQAEDILLEADLSRKKRKQFIDQLAAAIILQSYLDAKKKKGDKKDE
ncbi:MAG: Holliday junction resolvase RuvX [Halanaerobiaceae bacterium]|nr:Holliday junction resolvase RuvX [Halanaerobiaceae bacterium]